MHYMSPEQFFNFSLVRETTDVYSVGKILFEIVEGKMTDKVRPLKQVRLSNPETDFRQALNRIIMEATAEDPQQRISSARELKERLSQLLYCPDKQVSNAAGRPQRKAPALMKKILLALLAAAVLSAGAVMLPKLVDNEPKPVAEKNSNASAERNTSAIKNARVGPYPDYPTKISDISDHSILRLVPPAELQVRDKEIIPAETIAIKAFYLSETPVTNQQYVNFLNSVIHRVRVAKSDVYLDDRLVLKLSEKIRGYKPIIFENGRFIVKNPMHSACAVLMVTGYGAEAYAMHYDLRLPSAREWFFVMQTSNPNSGLRERMPLPTPVINYDENEYGLRGINQLAEWGKNQKGEFVILGQAPSEMVEVDFIETKNPVKYYTDTGFRVALDLPD